MRHSKSRLLHLAHPRPVAWSAISGGVSARLGIHTKPYSEWLSLLEESGTKTTDVEGLPALRIIDFFRTASMEDGESVEAMGLPRLAVTEAKKESVTLADENLRQISLQDISQWISNWMVTGFIPSGSLH